MWISNETYKGFLSTEDYLLNRIKELQELLPKKPKVACERCGTMTDYIPEFNVKYCRNCEYRISNSLNR